MATGVPPGRRGLWGPDVLDPRIRKPGDLPARRKKPADGVFRDRQMAGKPPSLAHPVPPHGWAVMRTTLYVCTTCKAGEEPVPEGDPRPGAKLHAALLAAGAPDGVRIVGVECLSACNTGCTVSLTQPGGWSYVYGRLTLDDVPAILDGAAKYAATADGIVPWRDRPTVFRKQSIARIPPQIPFDEAAE